MGNPLDIKGIIAKAIQRLSQTHSVTPSEIAVKIFLNKESGLLCYELWKSGVPVVLEDRGEEGYMSFNRDILGVKVDMMNREVILNQMIMPPALEKFAKETQSESPFEIHIMIGTVNEETCNPYFYLYKGKDAIRQLYIEKDF